MTIRFLVGKPIAYISKIKSFVITDLHIGIEHELYKHGIFVPSQAETFASLLKESLETMDVKRLIILGDVKHEIPRASKRELKEIPKFFSLVKDFFDEIIITKGNHDGNLEKILPKYVKVYDSHGFKIKNYGFFHGHAWPEKKLFQSDWLFMGHLQPAIELKDLFGYKLVERVWLKGKLLAEKIKDLGIKTGKLNLIIVPSFNPLAGSLIINKKIETDSFITKIANLRSFDVYLLDGTHLGKLSFLKPGS